MSNLNQFRPTDKKGIVVTPKNSRECRAAETLTAGDIVKIKDVAGPITTVEKVTGNTDKVFGVVAYDSARKETYAAGEILNVAYDYSIVKMEANATIAAGAEVAAVVDGMKVATAASGNVAFGQACIQAVVGELVPVMLHRAEVV